VDKSKSFFSQACFFEAALILVAIVLGWIADINPFQPLYFSEYAFAFALVATIPLYLLFMVMDRLDVESLRDIKKLLFQTIGANLNTYHWTDLFILAMIAGFAEELLFRGLVQPWIEAAWGMTAGLLVSNILFGLAHAVTLLYAVLAGIVGVYLGLTLDFGGERNLLVPMVIHGLYDFLAFVTLIKSYRAALSENTSLPD
jgi:hypothetical protein